MRERELSVDEKTLLILARQGSRTHYELWRKNKVARSNKTVLTALNRLESRKLVKSRLETSGRKRKFYDITLNGLIVILRYESALNGIDEIAQTQKDMLPLIFGKWYFFKEKGILNEVVEHMKMAINQIWASLYTVSFVPDDLHVLHLLKNGKLGFKWGRLSLKSAAGSLIDVNYHFLGLDELPSILLTEEEKKKRKEFLLVLRADPDLRSFVNGSFKYYEIAFAHLIENLKSWKSWWETIDESMPKR